MALSTSGCSGPHAAVDTDKKREGLINHPLAGTGQGNRELKLLGEFDDLVHKVEPARVRVEEYGRRRPR